jgi:hypothetical protein
MMIFNDSIKDKLHLQKRARKQGYIFKIVVNLHSAY